MKPIHLLSFPLGLAVMWSGCNEWTACCPLAGVWCGGLMKWWLTGEIHLHPDSLNELPRPRHGTFTEAPTYGL